MIDVQPVVSGTDEDDRGGLWICSHARKNFFEEELHLLPGASIG